MSNSWFQFKQFIIRQDKTAMKVGTDSVLLGAWADVSGCTRILDIGTGTGLIALMLAQRCNAMIDAVEIDTDAARQAEENVKESPWPGRIALYHSSFRDFSIASVEKYDLVICNPPFFGSSLKAKTHARTIARHHDELNYDGLVSGSQKLLSPHGHLCVILPAGSEVEITAIAKRYNLFPSKILRVRPNPGKPFKRVLMDFSYSGQETMESDMNIETGSRHKYSREYLEMTKDYYLFSPDDRLKTGLDSNIP